MLEVFLYFEPYKLKNNYVRNIRFIKSDLGKTIVSGVSNQTNQPKEKTQDVLTMAMPVLMAAMKRNASTPQGAEGLMRCYWEYNMMEVF